MLCEKCHPQKDSFFFTAGVDSFFSVVLLVDSLSSTHKRCFTLLLTPCHHFTILFALFLLCLFDYYFVFESVLLFKLVYVELIEFHTEFDTLTYHSHLYRHTILFVSRALFLFFTFFPCDDQTQAIQQLGNMLNDRVSLND